mmetsp:Transcript_41588/g.72142  ORF Transcript_41588/g.72142 Transcript_41588/m.72142 type:complete len:215 (+) Transcript_41588:1148-1792(+)
MPTRRISGTASPGLQRLRPPLPPRRRRSKPPETIWTAAKRATSPRVRSWLKEGRSLPARSMPTRSSCSKWTALWPRRILTGGRRSSTLRRLLLPTRPCRKRRTLRPHRTAPKTARLAAATRWWPPTSTPRRSACTTKMPLRMRRRSCRRWSWPLPPSRKMKMLWRRHMPPALTVLASATSCWAVMMMVSSKFRRVVRSTTSPSPRPRSSSMRRR